MVGARKTPRKLVSTYSNTSSEAEASGTSIFNRFDSVWSQTASRTQPISTSSFAPGVTVEDGKPTSKTSLGKVYYTLGKHPLLLLIDVDVTTGVSEKVKVPVLDETGEPHLDKNGEPVLQDGRHAVNEEGNPLLNKDGTPVLNGNGTPITQRNMVQSGRLREQALREYIDIDFTGVDVEKNRITFDLEARSNQLDDVQGFAENIGQCSFPQRARFGRTNRLIIPVRNKSEAGKIFGKFDKSKDLTTVKRELAMAEKRDHPEKTDLTIRCNVVRQGILIEPLAWSPEDATPIQVDSLEDVIATYESTMRNIANIDSLSKDAIYQATKKAQEDRQIEEKRISDESREAEEVRRAKLDAQDLSRRSIQLLFQHHWDTKFPGHKASPGNTSEFLANKQNPWVKREHRQIHRDAPWEYIVRYRPRFGKDLRLSFDYDLVPIINKNLSVANYAAYHFPANHPTAPTSISQTLKKLLQGLYVRYPFAAQLKKHHALIAKSQTEKNKKIDDSTTTDSQATLDDQTDSDKQTDSDYRTNSDDQTDSDYQGTSDGLATLDSHAESAYDTDLEDQKGIAGESNVEADNEYNSLLNRTYMIRDIKSNSEVGLVIPVTRVGEETKLFNVKKFIRVCQSVLSTGLSNSAFREVDGLKDEFNHLPLADIGKNKPFWVPLDLLIFSDDQVLPNLHQLTDEMKRLRKSLDPWKVKGLGRGLLEEFQRNNAEKQVFRFDSVMRDLISLPFPTWGKATYEPLGYTPIQPESRPRSEITRGAPSPKIAVVYITPDVHNASTELFLTDVRLALAREGEKDADKRILNIDKEAGQIHPEKKDGKEAGEEGDKISAKAVKSGPELFRMQDQKKDVQKILNEIIPSTANVLIGIVDGHKMSQAKYHEAVAEVKRLGDRRLGVVTICLNKQDLGDRFRRSSSPLFPLNVLRKIRFMLGSKNFETEALDAHIRDHHQQGLILIGAHISQPASDSTENCPAMAALVMSKPDDPSFYHAVAQLQLASKVYTQAYDNGTLPADARKASRVKKLYQPEIGRLGETLQPMFQAWRDARDKSSKESGSKKPRVVFYRDSCHETDALAHQNEVKQIGEAFQSVFGKTDDVPVSYVTVMKNSNIHSPVPEDKWDKDGVCAPHFTFTTSEYVNDKLDIRSTRREDGAKFQYHVHTNGDGTNMTLSKLRDLTALLNVSSQLCDYTSLALPVHYARKLARRTLSYYDYMSHKDLSNYPSLAKLTPYDSVTGAEQLNEVKQNLQVIAKGWSWVRGDKTKKDRKDTQTHPWHRNLDDKMFFL